jgi:hypothetical protein
MSDKWWTLEGEDCAAEVIREAEHLWDNQAGRRERYKENTQLFENLLIDSCDASGYLDAVDRVYDGDERRLLRSALQTARAEIFSPQQPKGQILTNDADWATRRQARRMDKIHEGLLSLPTEDGDPSVWAGMIDMGMGSLVQGTGLMECTLNKRTKKIVHRIVRCRDVYFDPAEGKRLRTMYVIEPIELETACEEYPDFEEEIREGQVQYDDGEGQHAACSSKVLRKIRAFRLGANGKAGRAVTLIGNALVEDDEEFTAPIFPFVMLHWEKHRESPWGMGLLEEGRYLAAHATDLHARLLRRARLGSGKRTYYREASVDVEQLKTNNEEDLIEVRGNAEIPTETVVPAFTAAEPEFAEMNVRAYWDGIGISQVSAAARREAGMETGVALRTLNNTKRGRQLDKAQAYELAFVQLLRQHTYRVRELAKLDPDAKLKLPGRASMKSVKISEGLFEDDDFSVTLAAASAFTSSPAGRKSMIAELFSQQVISPQAYESLLAWPDIDGELSISNVERDYIDSLIDKYLDAKKASWDVEDYVSPEPFLQDPQSCLIRVTAAYFKARLEDVPEFNAQLLYRFIQDLGAILTKRAAAQAPTADQVRSEVQMTPQDFALQGQAGQMAPQQGMM